MSKIEEALKKLEKTETVVGTGTGIEDMTTILPSKFESIDSNIIYNNRLVALADGGSPAVEEYKKLRTHILYSLKKQSGNTILITSPNLGDGKTLTAINLAITMSEVRSITALLVDADFRNPSIHKYLNIKPGLGLSDYLTKGTPLEKIILRVGNNKLSYIPAGNSLKNPSEWLDSSKMHAFIDEIKSRYENRIIIFDSSPILPVTDALLLSKNIDVVVIVGYINKTPKDDLKKAIDFIGKEKILGVVLNGSKEIGKKYYHYYTQNTTPETLSKK